MKKFKITDGKKRQIERRFLKVAKKEYQPDGLYVYLGAIKITSLEDNDFSIEYKVYWGRVVDGKSVFQFEATIWAGDGNLDFLAGQFYEKILMADGNE